jgi:hypothetical protein
MYSNACLCLITDHVEVTAVPKNNITQLFPKSHEKVLDRKSRHSGKIYIDGIRITVRSYIMTFITKL